MASLSGGASVRFLDQQVPMDSSRSPSPCPSPPTPPPTSTPALSSNSTTGGAFTPSYTFEGEETNNNDNNNNEEEPSPEEIDHQLYRSNSSRRPKLGKSLPARIFRRYPRTYAMCAGIIMPLWLMVALCLLFGWLLGELEYEGEIRSNDKALQRLALKTFYDQTVDNMLDALPTLCHLLYQENTTVQNVGTVLRGILDTEQSLDEYIQQYQQTSDWNDMVNMTQYWPFVSACGQVGREWSDGLQERYFGEDPANMSQAGTTPLTFNWIRCVNRSSPEAFNHIFQPTPREIAEARREAQRALYKQSWDDDMHRLVAQHEETLLDQNYTMVQARQIATNLAMAEATGEEHCAVNVPSAAWFWFGLMTIIGYGNQNVVSPGGRALIFTVGFLTILVFGFVLATAGTIISHIFSDFVHRLKLRFLVYKSIQTLLWALLWYAWMVLLAFHFQNWSLHRLDATVAWRDAYWFSYISTNTIGLGDFYPAPEELFLGDILAYSLSFFFGLLLLSTFIADLSQWIGQFVPDVTVELGKRLKYVGVFKHYQGVPEGLSGVRKSRHFPRVLDET